MLDPIRAIHRFLLVQLQIKGAEERKKEKKKKREKSMREAPRAHEANSRSHKNTIVITETEREG